LAEDPRLASVRAGLAQALLTAGNPAGAVTEASEALAIDASLVQAWLVRAASWQAWGAYAEAVQDFAQAASLTPRRPMILVNLATCQTELGQLADAERALRRALELDPGCVPALANLASVLVRQGMLA
jgi:Tfp pilus assembly protein PilF